MHKLGGRRALSFPHFRKEKLKLPAEIGGAAYRIRTYDPRITNAMLYVCVDLSCCYKPLVYNAIMKYLVCLSLRNLL